MQTEALCVRVDGAFPVPYNTALGWASTVFC